VGYSPIDYFNIQKTPGILQKSLIAFYFEELNKKIPLMVSFAYNIKVARHNTIAGDFTSLE
jgi:hypothetical protein